jgi:hypothetical protein
VSWLATKYAWKCENTDVKGGTRLVFLALALRVRYRRITTRPTSLDMLAKLTLMSVEQIRRCIDALEEAKEVRRLRRGKKATYAFPKMAGPLFVVAWEEEPVKMTEFSFPERRREKPVNMPDFAAPMTGFFRPPRRADNSSGSVRTQVPSTSTTRRQPRAVEAFLDWFLAEYPTHRGGVLYRIGNPSKTELAVRELLDGRTFDRAREMAIAMWQDTTEPWLNRPDNDRGIFALLHKSTYLEAIVIAQQPKADDNGHVPPCRTRTECIERVLREGREARAQGASA